MTRRPLRHRRWLALAGLVLAVGCVPTGGGGGSDDDDGDVTDDMFIDPDDGIPPPDMFIDPDDGIPPPDMFIDPDDGIPPPDMFIDPDDGVPPPDMGCVPSDELCNGGDDDCDGEVDEDFEDLGAGCTVGEGLCASDGEIICDGQGTVCSASAGAPVDEACNGIDDDCDGELDEDVVLGACNTGDLGRCADGLEQCLGGELLCIASLDPRDERCDGADDDCDGGVDEGLGGDECATGGLGVCSTGVEACIDGNLSCEGPLPREERCNGQDDDCDGEPDDGGVCNACEGVQCPPDFECQDGECVPADPCIGVNCPPGQRCDLGACVPIDVGDATPIAAVGGQVQVQDDIVAGDPLWQRADAGCAGRANGEFLYQPIRIVNLTGAPRVIRVTGTWPGVDGFIHIFTDPLDVGSLDGCLAGNDDFNGTGASQIAAQVIGRDEVLVVMASTYRAGATMNEITVVVETLAEPVPPEGDCADGIDNDRDGFVDCDDFDCNDPELCAGQIEINCDDNIDDDGNGFTDCEDFACADDPACDVVGAVECADHVILNDAGRNVNSGDGNNCDQVARGTLVQPGMWHRFVEPAGTQMPVAPPPDDRCTTDATGWLEGGHPAVADGIVDRRVCFNWRGDVCNWETQVQVRNCGGFYVYNLPAAPACSLAYCGETGDGPVDPDPDPDPDPQRIPGVQQNVPLAEVEARGWQVCHTSLFSSEGQDLDDIRAGCAGDEIMLACRRTGQDTLLLAAEGDEADVFFDVGGGARVSHNANDVEWYFSPGRAFGFAPGGEGVNLNSCDTGDTRSAERMCVHLDGGNIFDGGYRCTVTNLNNSAAYERMILGR